MIGRWISIAEAKERTVGKEEWWKTKGIRGRIVELKQHDPTGPRDKPIWKCYNGSMYLGGWKANGPEGLPLEHGFGIYYDNNEDNKGRFYVGNWKDGEMHGPGKELWLESSPIWIKNDHPISRIKEEVNGKSIGRPYVYEGNYVDGFRNNLHAKVTLKDGTCRVGRWKGGSPVGNWWSDEDHPVDTNEETRSAKRARRQPPAEAPKEDTKPAARNAEQAGSGFAANEERIDDDSAVQPDAPPSSAATIDLTGSDGNYRVQSIVQWLTETIGCDPEPEVMEHYARKFYEFGCHSVDKIVRSCTREDLESFDWLKPLAWICKNQSSHCSSTS